MFNFQKVCPTSYMKINIVGKQKFNFWRYTFYEFQGQSKGHKVKYLKNTCS